MARPCTDFCWLLSRSAKTLEKAKGIKRIKDSIYTEAHTRPWLSGLERDPVKITKGSCLARDVHRSRIDLEQIPPLEICLNEPGPQRGNQVQGGDECEDGKAEGSVEGGDWRDWIEERPEDEPEGDWDQDSQKK